MSINDDRWPRALAWLSARGVRNPQLSVVGVPFNRSLTPGRYDQGPVAIRAALERYSTYDFESNRDLAELVVSDFKNVPADSHKLEETIEHMLPAFAGAVTCIFGGDNGATRCGVRAMALAHGKDLNRVGLLTLDAHMDLRDLDQGATNSNPVRGLIKDGLLGANIHQIGLQSFANSAPYAQEARTFGIHQRPVYELVGTLFVDAVAAALDDLSARTDVIYVNFDLDVLDTSYAPGCPGARPGGIHPYQLRQAARLCGKHPKVRCADIVELDVPRDVNDQTALIAAVVFLEFAMGLLLRG